MDSTVVATKPPSNTTALATNNNTENEHLLEHTWVLWYRPPAQNTAAQAKQWESSLRQEFESSTVEGFWRGFHNVARITPQHPVNCDYSLFKKGVKPMWEDDFNKCGGRWTYNIERRNAGHMGNQPLPSIIEKLWLDVMLCLIGENFEPYGEEIAGGVCGLRQRQRDGLSAKIFIWTKDASNVEANTKIGEILKSVLRAPDGQLTYAQHETSGKGRSNQNNSYNLKL